METVKALSQQKQTDDMHSIFYLYVVRCHVKSTKGECESILEAYAAKEDIMPCTWKRSHHAMCMCA